MLLFEPTRALRRAVAVAPLLPLLVACGPRVDLPVIKELPELDLELATGGRLARADLEGRFHVVDFIFTNCPAVCPRMTASMAELYREYADTEEVRFLSISVDPENDTPEALRAYAERFGVDDDRWLFARGPLGEVQQLSEKGFLLAARDLPFGHSTRFVLVDLEARIRGYYDSDDAESLERLRRELTALLR